MRHAAAQLFDRAGASLRLMSPGGVALLSIRVKLSNRHVSAWN
jgi:hypothetical protein